MLIGNQQRPRIFDLDIRVPDPLYECVLEVGERVVLQQDECEMGVQGELVTTDSGKAVLVERALDEAEVRRLLQAVLDRGIRSLAVLFLHSYM